jgi:soluble lytic murein transglycosylase-like protein
MIKNFSEIFTHSQDGAFYRNRADSGGDSALPESLFLGPCGIICDKAYKYEAGQNRMKRRPTLIAFFALLMTGVPALSQEAWPNTNFTFKRVGVPTGSGPRITVQIDPTQEAAKALAPPLNTDPVAGASPSARSVDWFWDMISPELAATGPGRLEDGVRALGQAPEGQAIVAPRLDALQKIASAHGKDILRATVGTQVSPALVLAVIAVESAGDSLAYSRAGAGGLMQLIPATADGFGVTNAFDPTDNIGGGVAYLDWLMGEFERDPILFLAAYNAGEGSIRDNAGVPPYPETRAYVPKVLSAWTVARALCMTPPELMSDGCVFTNPGG